MCRLFASQKAHQTLLFLLHSNRPKARNDALFHIYNWLPPFNLPRISRQVWYHWTKFDSTQAIFLSFGNRDNRWCSLWQPTFRPLSNLDAPCIVVCKCHSTMFTLIYYNHYLNLRSTLILRSISFFYFKPTFARGDITRSCDVPGPEFTLFSSGILLWFW